MYVRPRMLQKRRDKKASSPKPTANTTQSSDGKWSHLSLKSSLRKLRLGKSSGNLGGSTDHGNLGSTTDKNDGNNGSIERSNRQSSDREEEKREEACDIILEEEKQYNHEEEKHEEGGS